MPKGRIFAPATEKDGVWFQHRGTGPFPWPPGPRRDPNTTTGAMQMAPFKESTASYPPPPPNEFNNKHSETNFRKGNKFSSHDNRHTIQLTGEYLGDGRGTRFLGKRNQSADLRHHYNDPNLCYERLYSNLEYRSMYNSSFVPHDPAGTGTNRDDPIVHRRFPRKHPEPTEGYVEKLPTTTTNWFKEPDVPYKTHLQVMASSQEPFTPHNPWKYSKHGQTRCYPIFDIGPKPKTLQTWLLNDQKAERRVKMQRASTGPGERLIQPKQIVAVN